MTRKRDVTAEIISRRCRLLRRKTRHAHVTKRIENLIASYWLIRESPSKNEIKIELYRYIPIGSVACIEGWFRCAVADLINHNAKYRENIKQNTDIQFDIKSTLAVHEKSVSVGEFIANSFRLNKLEDILGIMSMIIGQDFKTHLKKVRINPKEAPGSVTLESEIDMILGHVQKAFELRHIFSHELATSIRFSRQQIEDCVYGSFLFLCAAERVVQDLLGEEYAGSIKVKTT